MDLVNTRHNFLIANKEHFKWIGVKNIKKIIKGLVFIGDTNRLGGNT